MHRLGEGSGQMHIAARAVFSSGGVYLILAGRRARPPSKRASESDFDPAMSPAVLPAGAFSEPDYEHSGPSYWFLT